MLQAGSSAANGSSGFTLFEMLAVMVVMAMMIVATSTLYQRPSSGTQVKAAALMAASRLRDLRSLAMSTGQERAATIDLDRRIIKFGDGRGPLEINREIALAVTAAEGETRSASASGVRFYPNGSSSGATIKFSSQRIAYEVRINWLTGRVSTSSIN